MLEISKQGNPNYLAKVVKLKGLKKHSNADRLQTVDIDFQTVVTGIDAKDGNIYIYFPIESKINSSFISHINGFRDNLLNSDPEKAGFFEDNCRVKALKLRGEKSMGFIVPITELVTFIGNTFGNIESIVGQEFDTVNGIKLLEKYELPVRGSDLANKKGKKPKISRLIDGQVHLHVDTENLRKNTHKIKPDDLISISYKTHGTSWWVSNVQVKRTLKWYEKALLWLGVNIVLTEYDYVYGSRKVVKNKDINPETGGHYYGYDLWRDIMEEVREFIPENYTLYGECTGFDKDGGYIQKDYDYGCAPHQHKLEVYRITVTNPSGFVTELSTPEIIEFCDRTGLLTPLYFYYGKAREIVEQQNIKIEDDRDFQEAFVKILEVKYNDMDCFMCKNKVPAEGIVVRKDKLFGFDAYKLKSFDFLNRESEELDKGIMDMESQN